MAIEGEELTVETIDGPYEVRPGEEFTFGRSDRCTFCVDETDRNISRQAGAIALTDGGWLVSNTSSNRTLHLLDELSGNGYALLPGRSHLVCEERLRVTLHGTRQSVFSFTVVSPSATPSRPHTDAGESVTTLGAPTLTSRQRADLAALFWEYHEPVSGRSPRPLTYAQAAVRLGDTAKALEHRISHYRRRLLKDGYPSMELHELAIFFIGTRVLTAADFHSLNDHSRPRWGITRASEDSQVP